MFRFINALLVAGLLVSAYFIYRLEHATRSGEREIVRLEAKIGDEAESFKLLTAEWSLLTRPDRIQHLAQKHLNLRVMSPLQVINEFVAHAYAADLKWMSERLADEGSPEAEAAGQIAERADRYKQILLSAIGPEALPPQLRTELAELDFRNGIIDEPIAPIGIITTWAGPNPYSNQDEMAAMSPTELVEHLASWHDTGDGRGPEPSHEGQGRDRAAEHKPDQRAEDVGDGDAPDHQVGEIEVLGHHRRSKLDALHHEGPHQQRHPGAAASSTRSGDLANRHPAHTIRRRRILRSARRPAGTGSSPAAAVLLCS
jgi:cell division protein FtsL